MVSQLDLEQPLDLFLQTFLLDLEQQSMLLFQLDQLLLLVLPDRFQRDQQRIELDEEVPLKTIETRIKIDSGMLREEWKASITEEVEEVEVVEIVLLGVGNEEEEEEGIVKMNMGGGNLGGQKRIEIEVGNVNEGRGIESTRGNERGRGRRIEREKRRGKRRASTISSRTRPRMITMEV